MRRSGQPRRLSATICCCRCWSKTLLMDRDRAMGSGGRQHSCVAFTFTVQYWAGHAGDTALAFDSDIPIRTASPTFESAESRFGTLLARVLVGELTGCTVRVNKRSSQIPVGSNEGIAGKHGVRIHMHRCVRTGHRSSLSDAGLLHFIRISRPAHDSVRTSQPAFGHSGGHDIQRDEQR